MFENGEVCLHGRKEKDLIDARSSAMACDEKIGNMQKFKMIILKRADNISFEDQRVSFLFHLAAE